MSQDKPLQPAPGVTLIPAVIRVEDTRFSGLKDTALFFCDFCIDPLGLRAKHGTWFKQEVNELLAGLRGPSWTKGTDCRWTCGHCWFGRMRREGLEVVDLQDFHKSHMAHQRSMRDMPRPARDTSSANLALE